MAANSEKQTILILDDESDNVDALERLFRKSYNVLKSTAAADALKLLHSHPDVALIISDQRMPQMTGVEFLKRTLATHPQTVRILLTGYTDINSVIDAINSGQIYRYVTKPWDPVDLANTVDKGVEHYALGQELIEKNRKLEMALAELQVLDKAKTQFMMLINHELKTPLTTIISFLEILCETQLTQEQSQYLQRIAKGTSRLREIVEDVLLLLSAEMQSLPVNSRKVAANTLMPNLTPQLFTELQSKQLKIENQLSDDKISTDISLIQNVLTRIVHNAIKFSPTKGNIVVRSSPTNDGLQVSVQNSGKMDNKVISQVTKPFFIDENMIHHSRGLGLGLTISQSLLRRLGSNLQIESGDNTVTVSFELR